MTWWAWLILGAVLFGAEILAIDAQFFLVFLGLSAALVNSRTPTNSCLSFLTSHSEMTATLMGVLNCSDVPRWAGIF